MVANNYIRIKSYRVTKENIINNQEEMKQKGYWINDLLKIS